MKQYHDLLEKLLAKREANNLVVRENRTDTPTTALFCETMRWDLSKGFPLITTKKVNFHAVAHELLWFLSGDTNIRYLLENNVHIWSEWPYKRFCQQFNADMDIKSFEKRVLSNLKTEIVRAGRTQAEYFGDLFGDLGPVYGHQWRNFADGQPHYHEDPLANILDGKTKGFDQIAWVQNEIKTNPTSRRLIVNSWNPKDTQVAALPPCHLYFQFFVENGKLSCFFLMRKLNHCALAA